MQCCTAACTGLRNSPTGVPMVTMTGPRRLIALDDEVKMSRLFAKALLKSGAAPCSMNGSLPDRSVANTASLRSLTLTVIPASAKASTSGIPTWPPPPTTVRSACVVPLWVVGVGLEDGLFNLQDP